MYVCVLRWLLCAGIFKCYVSFYCWKCSKFILSCLTTTNLRTIVYTFTEFWSPRSRPYIYDVLCAPPDQRLQCHHLFISACCTNCSPEEKSCISLTTWFPLIYSIQHKDQCSHSLKRLLFSGKFVTRLGAKNLHFFLQTFLFV